MYMKQELKQINDEMACLLVEKKRQWENVEANYKKEKEKIIAEFKPKLDDLEKQKLGINNEILKTLKYPLPIVVEEESVMIVGLIFHTGAGFLDKDGDEFYHTEGHGVDIYLTSEDMYGFITPMAWKERYLGNLKFIAEKIPDVEKKRILNEVAREFEENFF